ncbi:unnamed protein product [Moneuplotes crassus]|uniref:Arrestin C-terminal-like domain-containing protein n=1 Tax=Euplotes crassus TaxID=5936 RepID=A0AAD1UA43_EUPCR|nr:unnamed protein product [Moneuplotes crassus]
MGSNQVISQTEYGSIAVYVDQKVAVAGGVLTGMVCLNLVKDYPAQSVCVEFEGCEAVDWIPNNAVGTNMKFLKKNELVKTQSALLVFNEAGAQAGYYDFPFRIYVPHELPASVFFPGIGDFRCLVKYVIRGILRSRTMDVEDLTFENLVPLNEIPSGFYNEFVSQRKANVCSWFGIKKHGEVKMNVKLYKNCFMINGKIFIEADIDNSQCSKPIKRINLSLVQTTYKKSKHELKSCLRTTKWVNYYEGIAAHESTGGFTKRMEINLDHVNGLYGKFDFDKIADYEESHFLLAKKIQSSTNGNFVIISYYISVKLLYEIKSTKAIELQIPIILMNSESEIYPV